MGAGGPSFSVYCQGQFFGSFSLPLSGEYNVRNSLAAIGAGAWAGLSPEQLQRDLSTFQGVKRRQEVLGTIGAITLIDDFAHHPTAVARTLEGLRQAYPGRRLWAVFEPASATNARALFEERYLEAFVPADLVIVARVPRPERARGDAPFSPERLAEKIRRAGRLALHLPDGEQIVAHLLAQARPGDLVVFMSNGGFSGVQAKLGQALCEKYGAPA
jgi:UDP-N-acetylmuramate: L-alanyl-gamma-D-glutamyl-meso-diaminopimelate ligase